jgi:lysophospholipid acyltransferase (LPLAT)-like uncharacterized protein
MKLRDRLMFALVPPLVASLLRLLKMTIRTETVGAEYLLSLDSQRERVIFPFWHDQLLLMVFAYPGRKAKLLVSRSRDGELLTRTMRIFKYDTVRGSSSRGGRAAFRELLKIAKTDADIVLTPDGPRGPRHEIKDGVLHLARLSRRPVVPVTFACSRGYRFRSWDRCLLPAPFSRGVYVLGKPIYYEDTGNIESFRQQLQEAMDVNFKVAEDRLSSYGFSAV